MFNTISWQEFLSAITLIAGSYYVITVLLIYSGEIATIFKQKESKTIATEITSDQNDSNEVIDLMGKIKYESQTNVPHENIVEASEINVQQSREAEEPIESKDFLAESFESLLNEIAIIAEGPSPENKEESTLLFKSLLLRYPHLIQTPYEQDINHSIYESLKERCTFHLEPDEIKSWWSGAESPSNNHHLQSN